MSKPLVERIGDRISAMSDNSGTSATQSGAIAPRTHPQKIRPGTISNTQVSFSFRAVHRTRWIVGLLIFIIFFLPMIGSGIVLIFADAGLVMLVIGLIFSGLLLLWCFPMVEVRVNPETIKVGGYLFDRRYTGGFRIGYEMESPDKSFTPMTGLRMSYGPWGEDLPFLVSKNRSVEMINWMNQAIDHVALPDTSKNTPGASAQNEVF